MLRSRKSRREDPLEASASEAIAGSIDPERETLLADAVGPALLVVLDTFDPGERLAFVLHDMFATLDGGMIARGGPQRKAEVGLTAENAPAPRTDEADAPAQSGPAANIS